MFGASHLIPLADVRVVVRSRVIREPQHDESRQPRVRGGGPTSLRQLSRSPRAWACDGTDIRILQSFVLLSGWERSGSSHACET